MSSVVCCILTPHSKQQGTHFLRHRSGLLVHVRSHAFSWGKVWLTIDAVAQAGLGLVQCICGLTNLQ